MRFEHDAVEAWHQGPTRALDALGDIAPRGVSVAAMVPSLTAVDAAGVPCAPGLLYGDERGNTDSTHAIAEAGELMQFMRWHVSQCPDARGDTGWRRPSRTTRSRAFRSCRPRSPRPRFRFSTGRGGMPSSSTASAYGRIRCRAIGVSGTPLAEVHGRPGCVLEGGTIDALGEQIVAGADEPGDVLAILGTTLIIWCVIPDPVEVPNHYTIPHTAPGRFLVGGPSNAGGLFLNWANGLLAHDGADVAVDPGDVPIWAPYPRANGCRSRIARAARTSPS